ncbi:amidase signature domain-containing protein [Fusarium pseudocircinatum]|uniref:Amidase signature domain-containing protein n=1 Tax=Fusarium pseudocircinatum TaxID=56676 RepID=A0A8H5NTW2_9HYPO|nr:amidase signature domain-containing protein [Fusarium pseudocircinatum]
MSRISAVSRQRLILAAKVAAGVSLTGAASFHLVTRKCYFEPFGPENGRSLYEHPLLKQINPWNKPGSADSCVREVPFEKLDKVLLEDAKNGGTKLVETFIAGMWGGFGYGIQRRIMTFFKNETNKNDLWEKKDLLASTYEPGTYFTNHFVVLSKTPTCITMRGCFDPHQSPPSPMDVDNLVEIRAELDEAKQVAVLKLQVITFDGRKEASDEEDPFAFLLTALFSAAAEVADRALSGKLGRADFSSELESLAVREAVAVFARGGEVWETLGSTDGGAGGGEGDEEEERGGELHDERFEAACGGRESQASAELGVLHTYPTDRQTGFGSFGNVGHEEGASTGLWESIGWMKSQLVTVFTNHGSVSLSKEWLKTYLNKLGGCDVYDSKLFLSGVIITTPHRGQTVPQDSWDYLKGLGMKWLETVVEGGGKHLPTGPYFYTVNKLHPVCRLSPLTAFEQLGIASTSNSCLAIAVPSQAPTLVTNTPPNLRVAVKECFLVHGIKTSLCNKAYYQLSEPATFTADVVQALIDDSAHILGLTKLSSMIALEEPMDAVDYPTAFNPRGDGYQSAAGSSSGSAAAVAAYDWLDCAIGTDTSGSGRRPALANGIWQFRPSHDSVPLRGLIKTYATFDTPCVFARSLVVIRRIAKTWIPDPLTIKKRPYRLIYPLDYLPTANPEQMKIIDSFIRDAETHLPATIIPLSIRGSWQKSPPSETLGDVKEQVYTERHCGQQPYVIPFVRRRWAQGASVSDTEHEEATRRLLVYKKWLRDQLFGDEKSETLIILPVAEVKPAYRDEKIESPENQSACDELFLSPILGAPDVVIPIGEMSYHSKISNKIEYLPVVANLVAAPGRDHELLDAVEVILERSKRPKENIEIYEG